ncbi:efflux RND transporter periplasmic adaptor subunit [Bradyrhizobium diazoefficiens]|nr:efflux RND transporter periplasmic adaptor subunit [Bradyrhizobium diazoefficiens]UCF52018.1 MAG: efflux RND transporter periplasmic adaptor subunit [Bradyrhizobium sp.]MBR0963135.1 efflux RND transporter periplasmic adaptor subunit [Bradyrhizobium diazoefficiens]MBR0982155.1 efflux RND transporter periplasmic adaptor subunit [Bradyrhizobium diazoefficiens]MBR1011589.1 efflux RND transporter periplasmic adaptor subunit [Bradyrhizobium diazoefficiens]MBR1018054.1 efflux RND transporter perip
MTTIITTRRVKIAVVLVAVVAIALVAVTRWRGASGKGQSYITAPVTISDLREEVLASGTLKPARLTAVGSQVSGLITALNVRVGDTVKAGDVIAQIDPVTKQNDLRNSEASLKNYRAQKDEKDAALVLAEANLARQQATLAQRATSRSDFDSAESTVRQTRAQIAALEALIVGAEASVETARVNLEYTRITAPIDGTVLATVVQQGQTVNAVQSAPTIVVLGQLETMTVRAEISEADIVKVKPGQSLYFTILGDQDHRYEARLDQIEPAPESIKTDASFSSSTTSSTSSSSSSSSTSTAIYYIGVFNVPNRDYALRTYMTAEVHIITGEARRVKVIPSLAVMRKSDGRSTVRTLTASGDVSEREVKTGLNDRSTVEIKSGLDEGERVITGEANEQTAPRGMPGGGPPGGGGP